MNFTPTQEQQNIIDMALDGEDLKINAFAGASKTTTLTLIANAKHEEGGSVGMYLAFNKVTAVEAEGRFPNSVECRTVHSLAYRHTPKKLTDKLKYQKVFPKALGEMYKFNGTFVENNTGDRKYISVGAKVSMMNRTIARFCNSADKELDRKHLVNLEWMRTEIGKAYDLEAIYQEVLELSKRHWEEIIDPKSIVPMTHEAYLKLYSMLGKQLGCQYIMIDENQDSSPVILAIVEAQKKAQKIYVGDRYQAIYGWRGAINAMDIVSGESVYLTKSFRFGNNVESIANLLLNSVGNELPLKGNGSEEGKLFANNMPSHPNAVICRTNAGVIQNIFDYSEKYPNKAIGASCDLREIEKFVFAFMDLSLGKKVEHPLLFAFDTVSELRDYCDENPEDLEISGLVKLIDKFGAKGLISAIKRCEAMKKPDIMVTTAHKSKGLEWDDVLISNDFFYECGEGDVKIETEELNLLYVACTRAKRHMDVGGILDLIFHMSKMQNNQEILNSLDLEPEDDEYGDDDVARATGGVTTSSTNIPMLEAKAMYISAHGVVPTRQQLGAFIDKHSKYHGEALESWLDQGDGSFGGKILGAGGKLLDVEDDDSPELTTF